MLRVDDITIQYGEEKVLEHFSCHIHPSTLVCITGKSGCGKSSLLRAFMGMAPWVDGTIHIDGIEVGEKTCSAVRSKTVYLPQDLSFPCEYVDDLISLVLQIGKVKREKQVVAQLQQHLAILGLEAEIVNKRMSEISGGQRQRLILAILALLDKSVWLLDEPTSALDDESRDRVAQFLLTLQHTGKTIVAVSHDARFAEQCSTIISID